MTQLTIETTKGSRVFDSDGPIRIGRDPGADLVLDNPNVSRFHAELRHDDGAWILVDMDSTQGVYVNGQRVTRVEIDGRTEVVLGRTADAEHLTIDAPTLASSDAATRLPPRPAGETIMVDEGPQRPGGVLRAEELTSGTVVTGHTVNVEVAGRNYTFEPGSSIVFGRDDDCDVVTANPTVSRRHAELRHDGTQWHLVDLGSSRGTFVDGDRISDRVLQGSQAAFLGDPEAGERVVLVTSGETVHKRAARTPSRTTAIVAVVAAAALIGVIVLALVLLGKSSSGFDRNRIARATVKLDGGTYTGSGVIIDAKKGLILTNAHVGDDHAPGLAVQSPTEFDEFDSSPRQLLVYVTTGADQAAEPRFRAERVAVDGYEDIAVLRITQTTTGALISPDDLKGLVDLPLGSSAKMKTGDKISIVGYPGSSDSKDPTITDGIIASEVQDNRLNTNRAWFNETAGSSAGNSGGAVVDRDGRLVGVLTKGLVGQSATPGRSRPIDLARKVIDAAESGRDYTSPYVFPLPTGASVVDAAVVSAAGDPGFSVGCDGNARSPKDGADAIAVQVQYTGFTPNQHQDMFVDVEDLGTNTFEGYADTNSDYPFTFDRSGCVTGVVQLKEPFSTATQYRIRVRIGPKYDEGLRDFAYPSSNTSNNTNNNNNNPVQPPSASG